jgi:hypothetical protein
MSQLNSQSDFLKGFTHENDIFKRVNFYQSLLKIIINSPEKNLVFALDDRWGQGKTSFVKMMHGEINKDPESNLNVIYFDAYENDYYSDPFIPIVAEFHALFSEPNSKLNAYKDSFLSVSKRVGAAALIGTLKAVITTSTASIVDGGKVIDAAVDAAKSTSDDLTNSLQAYVEKKITAAKEEKADIATFKKTLSDIHEKSGKKTIFIIDELDRAKPDFSLDLLEKIKHLFSVEGVIFILVMNKGQFEKCIEKRYGSIDSKLYLNKFINYFITLPKTKNSDIDINDPTIKTTIYNYIRVMPEANKLFDIGSVIHISLSYLIEINNCSLREAERCISLMNLFSNKSGKIEYNMTYSVALSMMIFLKVYDPTLLENFLAKKDQAGFILRQLQLESAQELIPSTAKIHSIMQNLIKFHYYTRSEVETNIKRITETLRDLLAHSHYPSNPFLYFKDSFDKFSIE